MALMIAQYMQEFADRSASVLGEQVSTSITMRNHGMLLRTASSDARSARCDQVEVRRSSGPCLTAMDEMTPRKVLDLSSDPRWTHWSTQASREGFSSVVAIPARVQPGIEIALNLYSELADPWLPSFMTAGTSYAALIASAVRMQIELTGIDDDYAGRYALLDDETVIDWAVGAVTECNGCSTEEARAILTSACGRRNVTLREVAETVLRALAPELSAPGPGSTQT